MVQNIPNSGNEDIAEGLRGRCFDKTLASDLAWAALRGSPHLDKPFP